MPPNNFDSMKRFLSALLLTFLLLPLTLSAQKQYDYVTYSHDAMNTRIYKLNNGLQVFLTVYKDEPRIQCLIPVRVGSKNDPAETTGLAHYLEHLMFKGTTHFGTTDYEAEKPLLDQIQLLFEEYRHLRDQHERDSIYHIIDSISYIASGYAIPNEYNKIMKYIGSQGTNAATSNDYTVYIENIPSNQLENWAAVQYDRFTNPVFRLFHTELETVYEEKNTSLTNDDRKANEVMLSALFPKHPYGQQTTLGTQEHLKNPSLKNIQNFYNSNYTPEKMAICLAGDFDFDEAIAVIDKYFGKMQPKRTKRFVAPVEDPITQPVVLDVIGHEAEKVLVAFRMDLPANSQEIYLLDMLDEILSNGKCGVVDLNLNQRHLVNRAGAYSYVLCDNSAYVLYGRPNAGQSLDEVRDLLLQQIELVRRGEFDESLIESAINNIKVNEMRKLESNRARANALAHAFEYGIDWYYASQSIKFYEKITKQDIINFVNKHFSKDGYVVVRKLQGEPSAIDKVTKPAITAIQVNRDAESVYFQELKQKEVKPIEPKFVDFQKEITFDHYKSVNINYLQNVEDEIFTLQFVFPAGEMNDVTLPYAIRYLSNLGTSKMTVDQIKSSFFNLACNYSVRCSDDETTITLSGLSSNMDKALALMMEVMMKVTPDTTALKNMVADLMVQRKNAKKSQNSVLTCLQTYGEYGPELIEYQLSDEQIQQLDGDQLLLALRTLLQTQPEILYYGPMTLKQFKKSLSAHYKLPKNFVIPAPARRFERLSTPQNRVLLASYPAKQSRLLSIARSDKFQSDILPLSSMYNNYFGGSMNAIVFQEMREKRSLAYSAKSSFVVPSDTADYMYNYSYVATQNDKIVDAMTAFDSLFNAMPLSETAFALAKDGAKSSIAANRITKMNILTTYLRNRKMGINYDYRQDLYRQIDGFTLQDIRSFNEKYIQNQPKTYLILAKEGEVDIQTIEKLFGPVTKLSIEEIFGY